MKKLSTEKLLSLLALSALTVYVVACVSFSPDDSKIAYPVFEEKTGALGISIFDRKTEKSESLFIPGDMGADPALIRPQWTADGKSVLLAWQTQDDGTNKCNFNLMKIPFHSSGPVRFWAVRARGDFSMFPLPMAGSRLFFQSETNEVTRLDVNTGESAKHSVGSESIQFLQSASGNVVYYLAKSLDENGTNGFGQMDPVTFEQTPIMKLIDGKFEMLAISPTGRQVALIPDLGEAENYILSVYDAKNGMKTIPLDLKRKQVVLGAATFSPKGDSLYASYESTTESLSELGLIEIPINGEPSRRTILITGAKSGHKDNAREFEIGLSHDGTTAAACSTYLEKLAKPEDRALFLIDLTKTPHAVKKIVLPGPPEGKPEK